MNEDVATPNDSNLPPKKSSRKRKTVVKLPTPPPDPTTEAGTSSNPATQDRDKDNEVLDYIDLLHKSIYSRSTSTFAPAIITEEAFDHLEKLYKLMEQMLDLREQNVKLHRRIRDLEHLNNLGKFHSNLDRINIDEVYPDLDKDAAFAETILESILQDTAAKNKELQKQCKNLRPSILRRHRSGSGTEKQVTLDGVQSLERDDRDKKEMVKCDKPAKISKWTKVKAAFRWEKASTSVGGESKSQDSGIHVPVNYEIARYLRVPSTSDDAAHSPGDSGAGISTPGSISSASSNDDFHRPGRGTCEDFRSSEDENLHLSYIPHSKKYRTKSSHHHHRTPWAKMKDIMQPRSSFKKKHRLSAASDDIQIDVELCSDNEDVFEEDATNKSIQMSLTPSPNVYSCSSSSPCDVPAEVVERYQKVLAEDSASDSERRPSRWSRVRKAFLSHDAAGPRPSRQTKDKPEDDSVEEEIRKNYRNLQKKLSLEFQEKLFEWERMKQNSPGVSNISPSYSCYSDENRDPFFIKKMEEWQKLKNQSPTNKHKPAAMTREYELPPEFKKKLEEWEKIKRSSGGGKKKLGDMPKWKSVGGHRSDAAPAFEYPPLSDEFRKKLEEWKQIKAGGGPTVEQKKLKDKTPSPKLSRKNSSPKHNKKHKENDKELHWVEKELTKIEKEKQRLEREKQKFIEREERLSKLRKSVLGTNKKEILIHTPTGFHRFEGISRKFTQKLYEWEKSQGIGPEDSTFALLSSCRHEAGSSKRFSTASTPPLHRSKSADSIVISALNLACPLMSPQPSSLSLNDMDELEKECMVASKTSSLGYLMDSKDNMDFIDEPEAVLVEVEDYEEETAEPLHMYLERHQLPVYQRQEFKPLCEGETVAAPKIRRSESARAQVNYDLIETILQLLADVSRSDEEIRLLLKSAKRTVEIENKIKMLTDGQIQLVKKMPEKIVQLQEANNVVATNIVTEGVESAGNIQDILGVVQDISSEILHLVEQLEANLSQGTKMGSICELCKEVRSKISDLKRHLSYVCAASDSASPKTKQPPNKLQVHKSISNESGDSRGAATSDNSRSNSQKEKKFIKWDNGGGATSGQGAVKKRIRSRQKSAQKPLADSDEDEDEEANKKTATVRQHKKLTRTRSISESSLPNFDPNLLMPTKPNVESTTSDSRVDSSPSDSPVTVFVKTTRKLFVPIVESGLCKPESPTSSSKVGALLPPLPASPVPQRKVYKDLSPGIRLMISKYNQKLSETESGAKSGGSSGSNSPVAWRSPVLERRVRAQTEKYQEELKKMSTALGERKEVQKSVSASVLPTEPTVVPPRKTSLNSCVLPAPKPLTLDIALANQLKDDITGFSPEVRMRKIQRAKEEFLRSGPVSAPSEIAEESLQFPERNRLSQISVGSGSSCDNCYAGALIKSASAGMINVDVEAFKRVDPEYHSEGYVSLPRFTTKKPGGKSAFSTIAAKFRKVKMRRGKEKLNAVSTLCRQSLVVNISEGVGGSGVGSEEGSSNNNNGEICASAAEQVSSRNTPSSLSKSSSWIRRSLFKK
ncbi:uncharacterized protein LOC132702286 isoform X2 [Cylas formicarius]|uniref:uncharacterized protein LOC132702286 isoform X2 n=1 Tax=Cylas formicarius TaxID=197179 RepID=UPI0029583847|nr:uncharacterized protein LOC132702286 isoform X2 [Cylas formicarius]